MDDPTGPGWTWPYWKFGLQREDLETKLHDQYNTFSLAILDPEAFHHDVYELAHRATTTDELHQLLAERKQLRVRELNESLESAAFEIIGNPSLIGTDQWQHAVQLFRTRSLDSLVRYFASYLPEQHPWHKSADSGSVTSSSADSCPSLFDDEYYDPIMLTEEPLEFADEESIVKDHLPPSPRSMTMCSNSSADSHVDGSQPDFALTPARTLSYSEYESDHLESSASTLYDVSEVTTPAPEAEEDATPEVASGKEASDHPKDLSITSEPETPTPKPEHHAAAFFEQAKPSLPCRRHRSLSPSSARPLSGQEARSSMQQRDPRKPELPTHRTQVADDAARRWKETGYMDRLRHRMFNPLHRGKGQGRKTQTSSSSRIHKPSSDRTRLRGRKRIDS